MSAIAVGRTNPAPAAAAPAATQRPSSSASRHTTARHTNSASAYTIDITNAAGMNANSTTVRSAVASSVSLAARCQRPTVANSPAISDTTHPTSTGESPTGDERARTTIGYPGKNAMLLCAATPVPVGTNDGYPSRTIARYQPPSQRVKTDPNDPFEISAIPAAVTNVATRDSA